MGAGRKTQTITVKEKSLPPSWTGSSIDTARNLRTSDLAAVIFGCKHGTIKECFSSSLFGLPAPHYTYVKNIYRGMPLFLFNYSDRKLHGIFEATSDGQLNINSQAWTEDSSDSTPYAAQVKFRIRMRCQPLVEEQFSPIIAENYYALKLFWFELDQNQTNKLISLFSSLPVTQKHDTLLRGSFGSNARDKQKLEGQIDDNGWVKEKDIACVLPSSGISYSSVVKSTSSSAVRTDQSKIIQGTYVDHSVGCMGSSLSQKSWTALFDKETTSEDSKALASESSFPNMDQQNLKQEKSPYTNQTHVLEAPANYKDIKSCGDLADTSQEMEDFNLPEDCYNSEWSSSCVSSSLLEESQPSDVPVDRNLPDKEHDTEIGSLFEAMANMVIAEDNQGEGTMAHSREACASPTYNSLVAKLLLDVEVLKRSQLMQNRKISLLEQELIESRTELQHLKDKCKMWELSHLNTDELLLVAGGYDGSFWLSALDSYCPFQDLKKPLASMNFARSHASAANLNGELYVFGGVLGDLWYDTELLQFFACEVESYNPARNQWVSRPSLSQRKGHLAGISSDNKIFAVGGGNEGQYLSEVEMLDVNSAKWVPVQSMLEKRYAPAAAEISGILYAVGGYNGRGYLNSAERFDPRESSWTRIKCMTTKRGWHSLAVLNEKLYALGGYDGHMMVSIVEVFDPRVGSWMIEGSLNEARGYFGAVVMRDSIYVIGGLNDNGIILDTVECYKLSHGWKATNLRGIGKRSFFCAAVL